MRRRRYPPPYGDPRYPPGYGYRRRRMGGGGCARDACLIESGCCLAEGLSDGCLVIAIGLLGRLLLTLAHPGGEPARPREVVIAAIGRYRREISARRSRPCCRFTPTCSSYAEEAVQRFGAVRGSWLAVRRIARCRPGGRRGADPVPTV